MLSAYTKPTSSLLPLSNFHACFTAMAAYSQSCASYEVGLASGTLMGSRRNPFDGHVYLNLRDKAVCGGTVYAWRCCFIASTDEPPLELVLAMYRPQPNGSYLLVPGSHYQLQLFETFDTFTCRDVFLQPAEYFRVQENDVVAFCEDFNINRVQVYLSEPGTSVWRWDAGGCSESSISLSSSLTQMTDRVFMISAYIGMMYFFTGSTFILFFRSK